MSFSHLGSDFSSSFSGLVARYFSPAFSEENYTVLCGNRLSSLNFHWFYNNLRSPSRHWPDWAQAALSLHRPVFPVLAQCSLLPALCPRSVRTSGHISEKSPAVAAPTAFIGTAGSGCSPENPGLKGSISRAPPSKCTIFMNTYPLQIFLVLLAF